MAITNITNLTGATNFYDIIVFSNQVTNGIMGMMLVVVTFFILLSLFTNKYDFASALMASSFISFVFSILLVSISLLNPFFIFLTGILLAFTVLRIMMSKS